MNILYINPDPPRTYRYYDDLYKQLRKIANCNSGNPDVIVYGLTWFAHQQAVPVAWLVVPQICFVHKIGLDWEYKERFLKRCDLVLSSVTKLPIPYKLFKYAADPEIFKPRKYKRKYDFGFSGALHNKENYPKSTFRVPDLRKKVQDLLRGTKWNCFLNGSDSIKPRIRSYEDYAKKISQSKIWLATTGPNGDVGPRYYEVWASKALLFCDRVPEEYRDTFRDGVNCIEFSDDLSDFLPKLRYYLENDGERKTIINNAYDDFIAGHTWSKRAEELCCTIKNMIHTKTTSKTK